MGERGYFDFDDDRVCLCARSGIKWAVLHVQQVLFHSNPSTIGEEKKKSSYRTWKYTFSNPFIKNLYTGCQNLFGTQTFLKRVKIKAYVPHRIALKPFSMVVWKIALAMTFFFFFVKEIDLNCTRFSVAVLHVVVAVLEHLVFKLTSQ